MRRWDRFLTMLSTVEGSSFRGSIMPATDTPGFSVDFSSPRLILRTRRDALVKVADAIRAPSGHIYLVAQHSDPAGDYKTFRLFPAERQFRWRQRQSDVDALTGLDKTAGEKDRGLIYAYVEASRRAFLDAGLKIPLDKPVAVTNMPVKETDTLDGHAVLRSNIQLGLHIVEYSD